MIGNEGAGSGIRVARRGLGALAIVLGALLLGPTAADAQARFGVRAGFDIDPDAITFGGQVVIPNVIRGEPFVIVPNVEIGFGSENNVDYTIIKFNGDTRWEFDIQPNGSTKAYPLAGLSIYRFDISDCPPFVDCDGTEVGLNLGGGIRYQGFAAELKLGIGDIQDFSIGASYTFGLN